MSLIWVFLANGASMPSGVFEDQDLAKKWIKKHSLSGLLTEYPVDVGIYDWAIGKGLFRPKYPSQESAGFVGKFTSAYLKHSHYENGEEST
jgi:hypothetical protein